MAQSYDLDYEIQLISNAFSDTELLKRVERKLSPEMLSAGWLRVVYMAIIQHWRSRQAIPKKGALEYCITEILSDKKTLARFNIHADEDCIATINAFTTGLLQGLDPNELDPQHYVETLPAFLVSKTLKRGTQELYGKPMTESQQAELIAKLDDELKQARSAGTRIQIQTAEEAHTFDRDELTGTRITTGMTKFDATLHGGPRIKESALLVACPGVGKTTTGINLARSAIMEGFKTLFITLENDAAMILDRYYALQAHVPYTNILRVKVDPGSPTGYKGITAAELKRIELSKSKAAPGYGGFSIVDLSAKTDVNHVDIHEAIETWLTADKTRDNDKRLVVLDWLGYLGRADRISSNKAGHEMLTEQANVITAFSRKFDVMLWTFTQGKSTTVNREVLGQNDISGSFHQIDTFDYVFGLAESDNSRDITAEWQGKEMRGDRELCFTTVKNRYGVVGYSFKIYQGPTLRFWDTKADSDRAEQKVKSSTPEALILGRN
jgi:DNA polymerase III delta prime subunit